MGHQLLDFILRNLISLVDRAQSRVSLEDLTEAQAREDASQDMLDMVEGGLPGPRSALPLWDHPGPRQHTLNTQEAHIPHLQTTGKPPQGSLLYPFTFMLQANSISFLAFSSERYLLGSCTRKNFKAPSKSVRSKSSLVVCKCKGQQKRMLGSRSHSPRWGNGKQIILLFL